MGAGTCVRDHRAARGVRDRGADLRAFPDRRSRGRARSRCARSCGDLAAGDRVAVQAAAVRVGRWLAAARRWIVAGLRMMASLTALLREGLLLALLLAAPLLVAALIAGILTGLLGAFTQMQDPAISLAPRVAAVGAALVLFAPSIASQLDLFTSRLWPLVAAVGAGSG